MLVGAVVGLGGESARRRQQVRWDMAVGRHSHWALVEGSVGIWVLLGPGGRLGHGWGYGTVGLLSAFDGWRSMLDVGQPSAGLVVSGGWWESFDPLTFVDILDVVLGLGAARGASASSLPSATSPSSSSSVVL